MCVLKKMCRVNGVKIPIESRLVPSGKFDFKVNKRLEEGFYPEGWKISIYHTQFQRPIPCKITYHYPDTNNYKAVSIDLQFPNLAFDNIVIDPDNKHPHRHLIRNIQPNIVSIYYIQPDILVSFFSNDI